MSTIKEKTLLPTVYKFSELSQKAQEYAIEKNYNINVDYEWWEYVYEDAEEIGLKITEFSIDYRQNIDGKLELDINTIIKNIKKNHGRKCDTYKIAQKWQKKLTIDKISQKLLNQEQCILCNNNADYDEIYCQYCYEDEIAELFKKELLECYWRSLRSEYSYLTSDEGIKETLINNDNSFDEEGNII